MKRANTLKPYLFVAPAVILALTFSCIPFCKAFIDSFFNIDATGKIKNFAFLNNYKSLFQDKNFANAIKNTLFFAVMFVPLNTVLTVLAASLTRRKNRFSYIPEYIFFLPLAFSLSSITLIFKEMFRGRVSIINRIFDLNIEWLSEPMAAMVVLVLLGVFLDFGLDYIILLAAFRGIDKSVLEAARLDGANGQTLFFKIELPIIKSMVLVTIFLAVKDALLIVAPITILTEGGPFRSTETLMFFYYIEAFKSGNANTGNAITVLAVTASVIIMTIGMKVRDDV